MKKIRHYYPILILFFLSACQVEVSEENIRSMIFDEPRGLIAGIDIGDSWTYVKENHPAGWEVRELNEDLDLYQIRKDWEEGYNTMNLSFRLNSDETIHEMDFGLILSDGNKLILKHMEELFVLRFNELASGTDEYFWLYKAPTEKMYSISLMRFELNEKSSSLSVSVLAEL